jgi:hypothetical protein
MPEEQYSISDEGQEQMTIKSEKKLFVKHCSRY